MTDCLSSKILFSCEYSIPLFSLVQNEMQFLVRVSAHHCRRDLHHMRITMVGLLLGQVIRFWGGTSRKSEPFLKMLGLVERLDDIHVYMPLGGEHAQGSI